MQVLVDMNLSPRWVRSLIEAGIEAVHWSSVGPGDATDAELMRWASDRAYIVLTADLDFTTILATTGGSKPSIILLRSELLTPEAVRDLVVTAIHQAKRDLIDGAIVTVDAARTRLRILPIGR